MKMKKGSDWIDLVERGDPPPECKGLIYRCRKCQFIGSRGEIVERVTFTPLKKKSCPGCDQCEYLHSEAREFIGNYAFGLGGIAIPVDAQDQQLYRLEITNMSRDWETGIIDDWDLEMVRIDEEKETKDAR